jgi:regulator of cell morphogenesis and NO signaling
VVPADLREDPAAWTLTRLADHIAVTHHRFLGKNLGQTGAYARRIRDVHGDQHPELAEIVAAYDKVATELTAHVQRQEEAFFPAVRRVETALRYGTEVDPQDVATMTRELGALPAEHEQAGAALDRIRDLAMGYGLPPDACATYTLTWRRLQQLEADLRGHAHLEVDIMVPKAARLVEECG